MYDNFKIMMCYTHKSLYHFQGLVSRHPILGVVICRVCARKYNSGGEWTRDEDGYLDHCVWCAQGGENVFLCSDEG